MDKKPEKKQSGKVNYIWVLAGGYLIYLAYKLIRGLFTGEAVKLWIAIPCIVAFLVVGGLVLLREWKAYKYGVEHIDDPDSWSDENEEDEVLAAELAEIKAAALEAGDEDLPEDEEEALMEDEEEEV